MILEPRILKKTLPLVSGLIIFFGYIKLSIFYYHFNIKIIDYLEFIEILTLFLPDVVYYGCFVVLAMLISFISTSKQEMEAKQMKIENIENENSSWKRFKYQIKYHGQLLIALGLFFIWNGVEVFFFNKTSSLFLSVPGILILGFLLFSYFIIEFNHKFKKIYNEDFNPTIHNLIVIGFFFGLYSISSVQYELDKIESLSSPNISFKYSESLISTNENLVYLGQTRNYLFLHDRSKQASHIYLRNQISEVKIMKSKTKEDKKQ